MARFIPTEGPVRDLLLDGLDLKRMQDLVEGFIEVVQTDNFVYVINEEGKRQGRPVNALANALIKPFLSEGDYVVGNVIRFTMKEWAFMDSEDDVDSYESDYESLNEYTDPESEQ